MSKQQRYTEEFKLAAVKQVTERNYPVAEVAERLGISSHSLYVWIKHYSQPEAQQQDDSSQQAEIRRLKAELRRVTDERDILKKAAAYFAKLSG
ncbi:transposase [Aeromonas caviae]|jgi:transposase|nr:transposase [Aeromonas caviae]GJA15380.1 transposase [Aeromonas caviae]GJA22333.1 transposase [Aeromonas caviae]GJA84975.1 transposase [Aeromonas caviae]GJA89701.1 transposase [Aeromonas caviae]